MFEVFVANKLKFFRPKDVTFSVTRAAELSAVAARFEPVVVLDPVLPLVCCAFEPGELELLFPLPWLSPIDWDRTEVRRPLLFELVKAFVEIMED